MGEKKIEDYEYLIGQEVYGFEFKNAGDVPNFVPKMKQYVGKVGIIKSVHKDWPNRACRVRVDFEDGEQWVYPASQVKHHLVPPIDIDELFNEISKIC
jgi:hypothetical protein